MSVISDRAAPSQRDGYCHGQPAQLQTADWIKAYPRNWTPADLLPVEGIEDGKGPGEGRCIGPIGVDDGACWLAGLPYCVLRTPTHSRYERDA